MQYKCFLDGTTHFFPFLDEENVRKGGEGDLKTKVLPRSLVEIEICKACSETLDSLKLNQV